MILDEFVESGISQADLARRLGKNPRVIHRWLSAPENIRISTLSDLIFSINGGEPSDQVERPLDKSSSNNTMPEWLTKGLDAQMIQERTRPVTKTSSQRVQVEFASESV